MHDNAAIPTLIGQFKHSVKCTCIEVLTHLGISFTVLQNIGQNIVTKSPVMNLIHSLYYLSVCTHEFLGTISSLHFITTCLHSSKYLGKELDLYCKQSPSSHRIIKLSRPGEFV